MALSLVRLVNDRKVRGYFAQAAVLGAIAAVLLFFTFNAIDNLRRGGIASGFAAVESLARACRAGRRPTTGFGRSRHDSPSNATSRFLRIAGISTTAIVMTASASIVALMGLVMNTEVSPCEMIIARRRFSYINGPRMNQRSIGAGSHSSLAMT